jgi:hypothetical protein
LSEIWVLDTQEELAEGCWTVAWKQHTEKKCWHVGSFDLYCSLLIDW